MTIEPMLAALTEVTGRWPTGYSFEPKWDGYRVIATIENHRTTLTARSGNSSTHDFQDLADQISIAVLGDAVIDGEIIAMENGRSNFQALQGHKRLNRNQRREVLHFIPFDVLRLGDTNLTRETYRTRRDALVNHLLQEHPRVVPTLSTSDGAGLWATVEAAGLEGMIGKPDTSRYVAGNRGIWQKYKRHVREDFIVIGYSSGEGTRAGVFGALILGREVDGNLVYAGRTGTGFTRATALAVYEQLTKVRAPSPPVGAGEAARARSHASPRVITWTKPVFVATVESADHTRDGTPRFPAFKGMRPR